MKRVLKDMIEIYKPEGTDWMNFTLSKRNPYTYHHILERHNGGNNSVQNGAILTKHAHSLLHFLENVCPEAYNDLQELFRRINDSKAPLTQDFINEIDGIIYNLINGLGYDFTRVVDLSNLIEPYYVSNIKVKKKVIK